MKWILSAYALAYTITFGHAMHTLQPSYCVNGCEDRKAVGAFVVAAVWPLYWSTKIWGSGVRGCAA